MSDQPFEPHAYSDPSGHRYVELRPDNGISVELLINRQLCYLNDEKRVVAVVQWKEQTDGKLTTSIYAPNAERAASVPIGMTLVQIAELREQGVLVDFRDIVAANQIYWIADMRGGKDNGRSYLLSTSTTEHPNLDAATAYAYQEEAASQILSYDELAALVRMPPANTLVVETPSTTGLSARQFYDQGVRFIIDNMTAVQHVSDERHENDA